MSAYQKSRLRRIVVVAELDNGAGLIIDTDQYPPRRHLVATMEAEPDDEVYGLWSDPLRVPDPVYTLTVEGLGGFFFVGNIADWFAENHAPAPEQPALDPARPALPGGTS